MATARSGYTLQVIKAGQQGHVAASGISVERHHPASGESTTPAFIEAELKKIVQIVDGYEAAEDTHIVE